jgi:hypothetical protein
MDVIKCLGRTRGDNIEDIRGFQDKNRGVIIHKSEFI